MIKKEPYKTFNSNKKELKNNEYYTPNYILECLNNEFNTNFIYDPATNNTMAKYHNIKYWDTIDSNGLIQDWNKYLINGDLWINPPFETKKDWIFKAIETIKNHPYSNSYSIFILLPDKAIANNYIYELHLNKIKWDLIIPNGRINFIDKNFKKTKGCYFGSFIIKISNMSQLKIYQIDFKKYFSISEKELNIIKDINN